jgi:tripeptidyl-peptidase-2
LKKYPNYDGRNTIIAILDTGVDPGAAGLQVTSDGKPKIVDIVDCSGSGDIPTTTIVKPTENDDGVPVITGLTGRKLHLNKDWKNPSGEYRIGIKRAYDLFPSDLADRIKEVRTIIRKRKSGQGRLQETGLQHRISIDKKQKRDIRLRKRTTKNVVGRMAQGGHADV